MLTYLNICHKESDRIRTFARMLAAVYPRHILKTVFIGFKGIQGWIGLALCLLLPMVRVIAECNGQLFAQTPSSDFRFLDDGTVEHTKTGLIWTRCSVGQVLQANSCINPVATFTYFAAFEQVKRANFAHYLGFTTWHLPSAAELQSILEYQCANPAINSSVFPNTPSSWYWSSSAFLDFPWYGQPVDFGTGNDEIFYKINYQNTPFPIRLVRNPKQVALPILGVDTDSDGVSDALEQTNNSNVQLKDNDIRRNDRFIAQLYRDLLLREASAAEIQQQVDILKTTPNRVARVLELVTSSAFHAQQLDLAVTASWLVNQQIPTRAWLDEWRAALQQDLSTEVLLDTFMQQSVLKDSYASPNQQAYIAALGSRILGRSLTNAELQNALQELQVMGKAKFTVYWLSTLALQQIPLSKLIVIQIANLLANYPLDTATLNFYSHQLESGVSTVNDLIAFVIESAAYKNRFLVE